MTLGQAMHVLGVALLFFLPFTIAPKMVLGLVVVSCAPGIFYAVRYKSNRALWALPYGFFYMLYLSWTRLYALISPHKTQWLTRDIDAPGFSEADFNARGSEMTERRNRLRNAA
jgi:hyaluronan synthase